MAMAITANAAELTEKETATVNIGAWTARGEQDKLGFYQGWGKPARRLKNGDTVNIPANVKHWHGATPDSWFQHIALEVPGTDQSNEWCEPVDNAAYAEATK